jgi:siroheme synthase-like protein
MSNIFIPICLSLKNRNCLIVGGGNVALRKIDTLLNYQCYITVIAENSHDTISYYAKKNLLNLKTRSYKSPEASEYEIVISTLDNREINQLVHSDCKKSSTLINVVDNTSLCDFIFPAVIKRDSLTATVSTDGKAPFLSGHLKTILEDIFPSHWSKIAKYATEFREKVLKKWEDNPQKKKNCFDNFLSYDWKKIFEKKENQKNIDQILDKLLE